MAFEWGHSVKVGRRAWRFLMVLGTGAGLCVPAVAVAGIFETSRGQYDFTGDAQRFRKLPDPEVVLPLPALFESTDGGSIYCELLAERGAAPIRSARAQLTVDLVIKDLDAETFDVLHVGRKKIKTDATGSDTELFDFPSGELPDSVDPTGVVIRGRFNLQGGKKADRVSAQCYLTSEKRLGAQTATAPSLRSAGVDTETGSDTSSLLIEPARKLKRVPAPLQMAAIPRTPDDNVEIGCDAFVNDRGGRPVAGAPWILLVELLLFDHASRTFDATPIAVESQVTDPDGRAVSDYSLPTEEFGADLASGAKSAWILAGLDLAGNKKAGEVGAACTVTRR